MSSRLERTGDSPMSSRLKRACERNGGISACWIPDQDLSTSHLRPYAWDDSLERCLSSHQASGGDVAQCPERIQDAGTEGPMADKRRSLAEVAATIPDGSRLALGGNTLHRAPAAAVHELIRQRKRDLELVKTAGAYDVDLLCGTGCASIVAAGFVGYETVLGLAPMYRRAVESGVVEAREHACYTVIAGLRAASQGVPFMPLNGLQGSDLVALRGFASVRDPYSDQDIVVVPAIVPDVALIHVQEADADG